MVVVYFGVCCFGDWLVVDGSIGCYWWDCGVGFKGGYFWEYVFCVGIGDWVIELGVGKGDVFLIGCGFVGVLGCI